MSDILLVTQATPSTPSAGQILVYFKSDKLPYFKNDAGTETAFAFLSGGVIPTTEGGTGVANNAASTITISGAFGTTFTVTAPTAVTLPTSGTLYGTATGSITSAQLAASLTDETGTGANVFGTSPTITTSLVPGGTSFDLANTVATTLNIGGAATTLNLGASTGTLTVSNTTLAAKAITASTTLSTTGNAAFGGSAFSTWTGTIGKAIEVGGPGNGLYTYAQNDFELMNNVYYNAGYKFGGTGYANIFSMASTVQTWYGSSASGTAGNVATMNTLMTLTNTGSAGNLAVTGTLGVSGNSTLGDSTHSVATPYAWNNTGGTTAVMVDSAGVLFKLASARKYKTDFAPYTKGLADVLKLNPQYYKLRHNPSVVDAEVAIDGVDYTYKKTIIADGARNDQVLAGHIADDMDAQGLSEFIAYGPDGKPDSLYALNMLAMYTNAIKELNARLVKAGI